VNDTDRPLYEDLLKQRAALESLVTRMIAVWDRIGRSDEAERYKAEYDRIVGENRRREGLT
jgi:hypothetical protein